MGLNMFRLIGDLLHLLSILFILVKLIKSKSCGGISGRTQLLFVLTYSTRYLDIWTSPQTMYLMIFKITYITCYYVIALLIFIVFRKSYRKTEDTFQTELLLIPCILLALFFNHDMMPIEILWTFSIYLESVAIVPQFYMIYKRRQLEKSLLLYLIPLGLYRLFYVFNWIYRYTYEGHFDAISDSAGIVYVFLYILAVISFCNLKVEVTKDEHFLKNNIFFISSNDSCRKFATDEKHFDKESLMQTA